MKTAIITLDIINGICHPDSETAVYADRIKQSQLIEHTNKILHWARKKGHLIAHVKLAFRDNYSDASNVSPLFSKAKSNHKFKINAWDSQFCDALNRQDSDIEIIKHRVSAFYGTNLDLILRANKIERLILCGVATNNAVELTAREAHDRDYQITITEDATQTSDNTAQTTSTNFLKRITTVINTNELIQ